MIIKAFSPGHITGFFHIDDEKKSPEFSGSLGAGFCIENGVETKLSLIKKNATTIKINSIRENSSIVSKKCIEIFYDEIKKPIENFNIEHKISVPIECGFGTSGASALSLSYCLNKFNDNILSQTEVGKIAHLTDLRCKTGLGTVNGEFLGGFEIRKKAGAPGYGDCEKFLSPKDLFAVFTVFGKLSTKKFLNQKEIKDKINSVGKIALNEFLKDKTVPNFLKISSFFSDNINFSSKAVLEYRNFLKSENLDSAMLMFGNGFWTFAKDKNEAKYIEKIVKKKLKYDNILKNTEIFHSKISNNGGRLIQ